MIVTRVIFFLSFVWLCQIDAISSSALAKIKQATIDLETLLAQPVSASKADHDAVLKRIDELLSIIQTSGDAKAVTKYKGLVDSKKQAIDLSEKNVVLQEQVTQSTTQIATQEKQLTKASKKLESVGLSLPKPKTMTSDLIDEIDLFMKDFQANGNESNLDSFEQKIITLIQKALKKAEDQNVKNQIEQLKTSVLSIVHQHSLNFIEDGLKAINQVCIGMHEELELALDPFLTSFDSAIFGDEPGALTITIQESVDQVKTMHNLFKVYCVQNGFGKKILLQLDQTNKDSFHHIFTEFVASYEKILLLLLDAIETFNAHVEGLMDDPELAYGVKEQIRSNSDDWFNYLVALDLFEAELLLLIPGEFKNTMSPDLKPMSLIDMWDSLINKKINKPIVASSAASSIPKPPPPPLFVPANESKVDASFDSELAAAVKKQQSNPAKNIQIPPPSHPIKPLDSALHAELKKKQENFVAANGTEKIDIEQQLRVRLKKLGMIEVQINRLGNFQHTAHDEVVALKQQFDDLLYDKVGVSYSPRGSIAQYVADLTEIALLEAKLNKKMIDPKKAGMTVSWTDDQKKRFEDKKKSLQSLLEQKKKIIYDYGYNLSLESTKATQSLLAALNTQLKKLEEENFKDEVGVPSFIAFEHDLTYFYFLIRFGICEPIMVLPFNQERMKYLSDWCISSVSQLFDLMDPLQSITGTFNDDFLPDNTFGQRVIAPLSAIITIMDIFETKLTALQSGSPAARLFQVKSFFKDINDDLLNKGIIDIRDCQGLLKDYDEYIIRSISKKKK